MFILNWVNQIQGRKLALWGGFRNPDTILFTKNKYNMPQLSDVIILSNTRSRDGTLFQDCKVMHPDHIQDWTQFYVLVMSDSYEEIKSQLLQCGLKENEDFSKYNAANEAMLPVSGVVCALQEGILEQQERDIYGEVRSKEEYDRLKKRYSPAICYMRSLRSLLKRVPGNRMLLPGRCCVCGKETIFAVDCYFDGGENIRSLRENAICRKCGMNSRQRLLFDYVSKADKESSVYLYERITLMYKHIQKRFYNCVGSEYLGGNIKSGTVFHNLMIKGVQYDEIIHQDAMAMSFPDEFFDLMVSADVMEHVGDYKKVFSEAYRCLKKNGRFASVFPFFQRNEKTLIRAELDNAGKTRYLQPKAYHGNPVSETGSLVYTDFGWDVIDAYLQAGFRDAYALVHFSAEDAYFDEAELPIIFIAVK